MGPFGNDVFPFHLLHQVVILAVALLLSRLLSGWGLYLATAISASALAMVIVTLFIKPFPLLQEWFGMMRR